MDLARDRLRDLDLLHRVLISVVVATLLGAAVYFPVFAVASTQVLVFRIHYAMPGLGSRVVAWRGAEPLPGRVVVYRLPGRRLSGALGDGGLHVDRVLAAAADVVESHEGVILVNGAKLPEGAEPLRASTPAEFRIEVPGGHVFVYPSLLRYRPAAAEDCLVPLGNVEGVVFLGAG